jgi:hypothetical protein
VGATVLHAVFFQAGEHPAAANTRRREISFLKSNSIMRISMSPTDPFTKKPSPKARAHTLDLFGSRGGDDCQVFLATFRFNAILEPSEAPLHLLCCYLGAPRPCCGFKERMALMSLCQASSQRGSLWEDPAASCVPKRPGCFAIDKSSPYLTT